MPLRPADVERLPPMIPGADVAEAQRLEDLKQFRKYLVDTGGVKALMKLFQHTAQNEMRLDNPTLLKDFLGKYQEESFESSEEVTLWRENEEFRKHNGELEEHVKRLEVELDEAQRLRLSSQLWAELAPGAGAVELSLGALYTRLCGNDTEACPDAISEASEVVVSKEPFCAWVAWLDDSLRAWIQATLLPRLAAAGGAPPFESELKKDAGMSRDLREFLLETAKRFSEE
eukprot:CAMPEP_0177198498 /NCGR_PEP_ID=MMETSP0367-20130122/25163_1 /TAXON_ID=447022 ORGANISM="Scrippsiella hangoei-like, Strain SHHI-4" /NCGR_SAMPLE_ID=MMETSP0367 /ASSEMBLY_ACC=CAM_ASM_000362 /LENGTH=229 /DNA_ID=CAMNT_0018646765 /DNA_START=60 /DNA_END=749 /DNA_ORIENTATION=-